MTCNSQVISCIIFSFYSFIFSFSACCSLVATCFIIIACADFSALGIAHVFSFFVAFSLDALKTLRFSNPLVSDSTPTHGTICPLWLNSLYSYLLGIAVFADMSDTSDASFLISSYPAIIQSLYTIVLLEMI